ncbi:MAG: homoserine kinase [Eubacteriaceae bacterium]|nr:homoserine kinase [Eubacteriaceae bacterium]
MIRVQVPATSANLGPGFDAFGMAYQFYNTFFIHEKDDGKLTIRGVDRRYQGKNNLVYQAMQKVFAKVHYYPKGLSIFSEVDVPVSRGLGSSAICIVAGILAANALAGSPLSQDALFDMAVAMEGHPDNIAPAMFGGLVCAVDNGKTNLFIKNAVADCFSFHLIIPDFPLSTKAARQALPSRVSHKDAVFNVSRATMTYLALTEGRPDVLAAAMRDKLHQPYRKDLIRSYDKVHDTALRLGALGLCISGAGPTMLAVTTKDDAQTFHRDMKDYLARTEPAWHFYHLNPDNDGARLIVGDAIPGEPS